MTAITAPKPQLKLVRNLSLPAAVLAVDARAEGRELYAACLDGGVYAVDSESGERRKIGQHASYASGVRLLPGGETLISSGYDGKLKWHRTNGESIREIAAHEFWSWQLSVSRDGRYVASVTGQYLCGGYKYEPAPEREPSVRVYDAASGELVHSFSHVPPVQSVAFSPDGKSIAAGNLMGEIRVWDLASGEQTAAWTTSSFTGWGIIKGHYFTGGVFALEFTPDGEELFAAGMGTTRDPAAGNGRQLWQRFRWGATPVEKTGETKTGESGQGLMETLRLHPSNAFFVMAGRVFKGDWNAALFDAATGGVLHTLTTKCRVTSSAFSADGRRLYLGGALSQKKPKDGKWPDFGRVGVYEFPRRTRAF